MNLKILYPFQLKSAQDLSTREFGADFSKTGVGKTLIAMGVMSLSGGRKFLVITPKSVSNQWDNKFAAFWPEAQVFRPVKASQDARREAISNFVSYASLGLNPAVLVLTYEQVRLDIAQVHEIPFDIIYADEIHRIGNPLARTSKAMMVLKGRQRFGATATPLRSSPLQAFGIFNFLKPGLLGKNYFHFKFKFTVTNEQGWIQGYKNLDLLAEKIRPHYVMNTMEDAGVYMPPLIEEDVVFELSPGERKLYDNIRKEMLLEIEKYEISKIENPPGLYNPAVKIGKLQELTDSTELLGDNDKSSKLELLKDHLPDRLTEDNKVVIFTHFVRMAKILARELAQYKPRMIIGSVDDRQAEIDAFDNDPDCRLMIVTTAGNEGIDLQKANVLYMYDVPLGSYGALVQTRGRIERFGQTKHMVMYYLMARGTVDVRLKNLLLKKKDMSEKLFTTWKSIKEIIE